MRSFFQDVRFGLRLLKRDLSFTAVAVLTLAMGIAVNTTVFSWVDRLLLHPYPGATDTDRLALLLGVRSGAPNGGTNISFLEYNDYRHNLKSLEGLAIYQQQTFRLGEALNAQVRWGESVSANYFDVLGVKLALGRNFTGEEDIGVHPVAIISDRIWRQRLNASPNAIGRTLRVNGRELTVLGVTPPEFAGTMPGLQFDIWIPAGMAPSLGVLSPSTLRKRDTRDFYAIARLADGVEIRQANAEAVAFARSLEASFPETNTGISIKVAPVWELPSAGPELLLKPLRILMIVAVLLLLIVCANVANLLLAREVSRNKEFSVRMAMGAGGFRLGRQALVETMLLASAGGALGLVLAPWMVDLLPALIPDINAPIALSYGLNVRILGFTVVICIVTTLIAGSVPVFFRMRSSVNETLKQGGRSGSEGAQTHRVRGLLVVSEVALACLAVVGAGAFLRSFQNARTIHPGFDRDNVLMGRFYTGGIGFTATDLQQFCVRLRDRLNTVPGIESVSYADFGVLGTSAGPYDEALPSGYVPDRRESVNINRFAVAPGYFGTLHTPLLEGRDFTDRDVPESPLVIIVNQTFAKRYFPGATALGRKVKVRGTDATIVGVAKDSKCFNLAEAPRPHFYLPFAQRGRVIDQVYFFIRTTGQPLSIIPRLRREVVALEPKAAAFDAMLLSSWNDVTLLPQKITASMAAALGLIALALAAIGLYSVLAYAVSQRTKEIGIRIALGAQERHVLADVMRRGMTLTASGLLVGGAFAVVALRLVDSMLVNVSAADPLSFAGGFAFLLAVGLLACYVPAHRASKVDPMNSLRCE